MEASSQQVHEEKKFKKTQSCNIIRSPNQNTKLYRISNYLFGVIKVVDNENRTRIRTSNYNIVFGTKLEPPKNPMRVDEFSSYFSKFPPILHRTTSCKSNLMRQ
jgi:hypothetical protein